jgi:uncharacterized protein YcbK (DUF882 family)
MDYATILALQAVRDYYNQPITVTSGARCLRHNTRVGGKPNSQHLLGRAVDFTVAGVRPQEVQSYLAMKYEGKFGLGRYSTFTHFDTRSGPAARWG